MRKIRMSGSVGASGEQSPEATRPRMLPLPPIVFLCPVLDFIRAAPLGDVGLGEGALSQAPPATCHLL